MTVRPVRPQPIGVPGLIEVSTSAPHGVGAELADRVVELERLVEAARSLAVHLEQELAGLELLARALVRDLVEMHDETAIDLDRWPAAAALVAWSGHDMVGVEGMPCGDPGGEE